MGYGEKILRYASELQPTKKDKSMNIALEQTVPKTPFSELEVGWFECFTARCVSTNQMDDIGLVPLAKNWFVLLGRVLLRISLGLARQWWPFGAPAVPSIRRTRKHRVCALRRIGSSRLQSHANFLVRWEGSRRRHSSCRCLLHRFRCAPLYAADISPFASRGRQSGARV